MEHIRKQFLRPAGAARVTLTRRVATGRAMGLIALLAMPAVARVPDPIATSSAPVGVAADSTSADSSRVADGIHAAPPPSAPEASDLLPFARNRARRSYPQLGAGIGYSWLHSRLTGVESAFTAIEDSYRRTGYSISSSQVIDPSGTQVFSLNLRLGANYQIDGQGERAGDKNNRVALVGLLVERRFGTSARGNRPVLFLGIGAGQYAFSFTKAYHAVISPYETNGYDTLEHISLKGRGVYLTGAAGITLRVDSKTDFDLFAQYLGMRNVSAADPRAGDITVKLSGSLAGARLTFYY
jgi:hypothetical protein